MLLGKCDAGIAGSRVVAPETEMLSRYVKIYPCRDRTGSHLLYSTKKGSVVRVSPALLDAILSDRLNESDRATLTDLAILTADPAAERARMTEVVKRADQRRNKFKAIVVLNLDCNLACPYCFEEPYRRGQRMSLATVDLLIETIVKEQILCGRAVELDFYGGEALLTVPLIRKIAGDLQTAATDRGVSFSFGMVTNGTLLTRPLAGELVALGCTGARITLDGPPEIHDRQRPYATGTGSFSAIVSAIRNTYDLLDLQIGGNFTRENYREFPRVLDILLADGIDPKQLGMIQFSPIIPRKGAVSGCDIGACGVTGDESWLAEAALFLREETLKRGFASYKPTMAACMIEFNNHLIVNYDGSLYKCPAFLGWPDLAVGSLTDGVGDYRISHDLDLWKNDECLECAYLPLCFGGCRLMPLLTHGAIDRVDCRKNYYDMVLASFIHQDLRYRSRAT